ncbi:MAG: spermidine synthase [Acidobacteria bacterium]|nr:spermidine synthase [Acidobacteriota bacterium]
MLGNSVWASSLVMAAFMAGLAAGNAWAAERGGRVARPLRAYALLETVVGVSGLALVLLFPSLTATSAPLLAELVASPALLNSARMAVAFVLLVVPSCAMGATLPVLVRALPAADAAFGRVLGWLYGWNTLGAVAGSLAGDAVLVAGLGVRGAGLTAASLNLAAALAALALSGRRADTSPPPEPAAAAVDFRACRLLAATFLAGATLLALEVVWFRFLLLFVFGTSVAFATMLAVVLLGISAGSLIASAWLRARPGAPSAAPVLGSLAGLACIATYAALGGLLEGYGFRRGLIGRYDAILVVSLALMLPVSALSGALFTLLGAALKAETGSPTRAAGMLTLANTVGAALGALGGGFALLPSLGVERSIFFLSLVYGALSLLLLGSGARALAAPRGSPARTALLAAGVLHLAFTALFPFGLMRNYYAKGVTARWTGPAERVLLSREGLTETLFYIRTDLWGTPVQYRLATNGFSMSSTGVFAERYMSLFADLAMALRPDAKRALLVSYGVGTTARALCRAPGLQSIDVVDTSRDILELGHLVSPPGEHPLDDSRVRVHVEDGRFFLLTTRERFDIVTGEPPPPKHAGIVNLYTKEYFRVIRDRLTERGVVTYWLPVYQMEEQEARAVVRGFCDVFGDCSLWTGSGLEWLLVGTRGLRGPLAEDALEAPFVAPLSAPALAASGIEGPEQLGTLFLADAGVLGKWTEGVAPLDDDHPLRLSHHHPGLRHREYVGMMEAGVVRRRFAESRFIAGLWPAELRRRTLDAFWVQDIVNGFLLRPYTGGPGPGLPGLTRLLTQTRLRTPVLWLMGPTHAELRAAAGALAAGVRDPALDEIRGAQAMAEREYLRAEEHLARAQPHAFHGAQILRWRVLALLLAGEKARAAELVRTTPQLVAPRDDPRGEWRWLSEQFGLALPSSPPG